MKVTTSAMLQGPFFNWKVVFRIYLSRQFDNLILPCVLYLWLCYTECQNLLWVECDFDRKLMLNYLKPPSPCCKDGIWLFWYPSSLVQVWKVLKVSWEMCACNWTWNDNGKQWLMSFWIKSFRSIVFSSPMELIVNRNKAPRTLSIMLLSCFLFNGRDMWSWLHNSIYSSYQLLFNQALSAGPPSLGVDVHSFTIFFFFFFFLSLLFLHKLPLLRLGTKSCFTFDF